MIRGVEIFSGAGGLATGIGLSGVMHEAFVEWNSDACKTLRMNYPQEIVHEGDIREFDFSVYTGVDMIAGGPPCQPFSIGGKAKGGLDCRDMFPQAVRSIRELLPKAFFFENVKGLLRSSFEDYLEYILLQLKYPTILNDSDNIALHINNIERRKGHIPLNEQYDVQINLVNAADYGVPQKRERVIIVGIRKDLAVKWELPSKTHSSESLAWEKFVTMSYWDNHNVIPSNEEYRRIRACGAALKNKYGFFPPELKPWKTVRDAIGNMPSPDDQNYFPNEHIIRGGAREYPGHTGSEIDEPAKTIKAGGHGVPGGENMIKFSDGSCRYFTIFEAKRIQTFPDNYHILGSWTEAMRQIGNAVPVLLAQTICQSIVEAVFKS